MRRRTPLWFLALIALLAISASQVEAQVEVRFGEASLRVGGRLHMQYATTSVEGFQPSHNFFVRRARLNFDVTLNKWIDGRLQTAYVLGLVNLQDAYIRFKVDPLLQVTFGQFKRPFDMFELDSSTQLSFIERDGRIPGIDSCLGVGRTCSYSRFTEALFYSNRDMGIRVAGSRGGFDYAVALTNGETISVAGDQRGAKSWSGRVSYAFTDRLSAAANISAHDYYIEDADADEYGYAYGGDLRYGGYQDGLHVMWAMVAGDNWRRLDDENNAAKFVTTQGLVSYYFDMDRERVKAWEPVFRVSYGDPDTDVEDASALIFEPGVFAYFGGRNRIGLNWTFYSPAEGDMEHAIRVQTFLHF